MQLAHHSVSRLASTETPCAPKGTGRLNDAGGQMTRGRWLLLLPGLRRLAGLVDDCGCTEIGLTSTVPGPAVGHMALSPPS
mmetsp:Transcript_58089/g.131618  ORF Transcript_58089/g.131618 Transcript_58089/m.131618 type:complete len:81 (+) Transcript_58089:285-527(+)